MTSSQQSLQSVLLTLPELNPDQLEQIKSKCSVLLNLNGAIKKKDDREICILDGLQIEMKRCMIPCPPSKVLLKMKEGKRFIEGAPKVLSYFDRTVPNMRRVDLTALSCVGYRLLIEHLKAIGVPIGPGILLSHTHRLPEFISKAFPGYAECGLLKHVVIQNRVGHHET